MRNFNSEFNYTPYTGGAGPSVAEYEALNLALFAALQSLGLEVTREKGEEDEEYIVVGSRRVTYDRWGYCNVDGNPEEEIDQVDLNAAVAYMTREYDV